nr:RNA-directed DNA polymerase, eukaryota [Tanacetum cinerariifolium]
MGGNDWQNVTRKNHRSVFQRLNFTGVKGSFSQRSKEDHVTQISKSVFVTNFPKNFESSDLWKICEGYGNVIDVYIPNRKSKAGKRFAFVRFIRVEDIDRLIGNICTIWIGWFYLHSNVVRYKRPRKHSTTAWHVVNKQAPSGSYATVAKGNTQLKTLVFQASTVPTLVLDDSCVIERDLSRHLMGRVKQLNHIPNLQTILSKEGFLKVKLTYLGGLWVLIQLNNEVTKQKLLQHIGVKSWFHVLQATIKDFVSDERVVWVDIEGVPLNLWTHETFFKIGVSETIFGDKTSSSNNSFCSRNEKEVEQRSEDPFNLYDLLKQNPKGAAPVQVHLSLILLVLHDNVTSKEESALHSTHNSQTRGSILEVFDNMIQFKWDDFDAMVEQAWNSFSYYDTNGLVWFKKKLQDLKKIICSWAKDKKLQQASVINSIKSELIDIDKTLDRRNVSDEILFKKMEMGDKNSKFFYSIINKKCSQMSIHGIFVDGDWKTDPSAVKDAFKDHFAERFKKPVNGRLKLNILFNNRLSTEQVADLDRVVSRDEIRSAVWNYGENKSHGPDGYTFKFFRRYWRFVSPDFCFAVEFFF